MADTLRTQMFRRGIRQNAAAAAIGERAVDLNRWLNRRRKWPDGVREKLEEYIRRCDQKSG
uniref:Uncharacterized protein n=1 Tax=viral metagenome TaxID=1070528 RepID=A0A6M3KIX0_9ZZZZ